MVARKSFTLLVPLRERKRLIHRGGHHAGNATKAYADITMFGDVALSMLKMMGYSATVPGAILAVDFPAALSRLKAAIDAEKASSPVDDKDADEPVESMAHRALPLIGLLAAAA